MTDTLERTDDGSVIPFQLDQTRVQGRVVRLGQESVGSILARHDYPDAVARLLGEAVLFSCLVGSSLKFDGRISLQIEGRGPISLLVAEYNVDGGVRAYARFDKDALEGILLDQSNANSLKTKFGADSRFGLTVMHSDPSMQPYQGIIPLTKQSLAECADEYFLQSAQIPSKVKLAMAQLSVPSQKTCWRGGGMLIQKIASNDECVNDDDWETAEAHFSTISDHELVDPLLSPRNLLFRLFHQQGVRVGDRQAIEDQCTCSRERFSATLQKMPMTELLDLATEDGSLPLECQFCGRKYVVSLADVLVDSG